MSEQTSDDAPVSVIEALHAEVDAAAARVAVSHGDRLRCARGCASCCADGLTVFELEAERIRRGAPEVLREAPHAPGACAFLDPNDACRIYAHRPYVCRTQGLPLRWIEEGDDGAAVELRDLCTLNEPGGPAIETLPADACWAIGPFEQRLATLQMEHDRATGRAQAAPHRIALRDLFAGPDTGARDAGSERDDRREPGVAGDSRS